MWKRPAYRGADCGSARPGGADQPDVPAMWTELGVGDMMYIPRHHNHEGWTEGTKPSVSVSVTVGHNESESDLAAAINAAAAAFRKSLMADAQCLRAQRRRHPTPPPRADPERPHRPRPHAPTTALPSPLAAR